MSKTYNISEKQLKEGISNCVNNSKKLAQNSLSLLKNSKEPSISLGLYSFAIEEFGKAIILNKHLKNSDYIIPQNIFRGGGSHDRKFEAAMEHLPKKCWEYFEERYVTKYATDTDKEIMVHAKKGETSFEEMSATTGIFRINKIINFETRKNLFFVDWNDTSESWKIYQSLISDILLEESISTFIDESQKEFRI